MDASNAVRRASSARALDGSSVGIATKVELTSDEVRTALGRVLGQAQSALSLATTDAVGDVA